MKLFPLLYTIQHDSLMTMHFNILDYEVLFINLFVLFY